MYNSSNFWTHEDEGKNRMMKSLTPVKKKVIHEVYIIESQFCHQWYAIHGDFYYALMRPTWHCGWKKRDVRSVMHTIRLNAFLLLRRECIVSAHRCTVKRKRSFDSIFLSILDEARLNRNIPYKIIRWKITFVWILKQDEDRRKFNRYYPFFNQFLKRVIRFFSLDDRFNDSNLQRNGRIIFFFFHTYDHTYIFLIYDDKVAWIHQRLIIIYDKVERIRDNEREGKRFATPFISNGVVVKMFSFEIFTNLDSSRRVHFHEVD